MTEPSSHHAPPSDWEAIACVAEPTRRRVYEVVRTATTPLTRDEVATRCGIGRSLATFHLEALSRAGLLVCDHAPRRGGPGAGRPAKRYRAARPDLAVSLPPRRYDLAAQILLRTVLATGADVRSPAAQLGREFGVERRGEKLAAVLDELGYAPEGREDEIRLGNCPFHALVGVEPRLVCAMNEAFLSGLLSGLGITELAAVLDPRPPACCVQLRTQRGMVASNAPSEPALAVRHDSNDCPVTSSSKAMSASK
ncbi:MAG: helix-turn-helix domain-containing protein [Acidothermus sp.]|nr:helix-turn-helix domain-containing protein [Acidothermus sp.]MCL6538071.1 hypothetical protein [Acidothermus sp.]